MHRGGCGGRGQVQWEKDKGTPCLTSIITHLTCNCGGADINNTYRQCLVSMRNSTTYFTALTLFDTGAYTSFVNREVAKWLEQQQHGGTVVGAHQARSSRHDVPTSEVGLADTQSSSSIYGSVVFDVTFFNEITKSDNILKSIEANVIDSCIEVIIGLPDSGVYHTLSLVSSSNSVKTHISCMQHFMPVSSHAIVYFSLACRIIHRLV